MGGGLELNVEQVDGVPVVRAVGEIDMATAGALRDCLAGIPAETATVIVDLSEVTFLDSTGLSALVGSWKRFTSANDGAELRLVVARPLIQRVLEVTGLDKVFSSFPTLEEALAG
jgi:anti-anti-sigma factor